MVLVCNQTYNKEELDWSVMTDNKFQLSDFQKWAIWGITNGDHALITAHTGSGKTLPAEFMIKWFTSMRENKKKVIYASPIKALSNQKLNDMRQKYPEISFGLLTGDIKDNPDADVLIMTTEILLNNLFNQKIINTSHKQLPLSFNIDMENELGGVIFDEVHYINDPDRGSVWEQSILLLPPNVQMLLLSATINKAEKFACWVESQKHIQAKQTGMSLKNMILAPTSERVVPLSHYLWFSAPNSLFNDKRYKTLSHLLEYSNKPIVIQSKDNIFDVKNYCNVNKLKEEIFSSKVKIKRQYVLNELLRHLKLNNMLPAICFVFSRKQAEQCAKEIEFNLHDENDTFISTVNQECKKILISKIKNYEEFTNLSEYKNIIKLLEKGIAVHHAGVLPILREMIELLFDKGFIKLLFATETFAVGINMPTKTVIFSSLKKWDGKSHRNLYAHEYTQMAGRAGRRGLDSEGFVIHLNNLFELDSSVEYKKMLCGSPPEIISKFKISYNIVLNVIASGGKNLNKIIEFIQQSLISSDIKSEVNYYKDENNRLNDNVDLLHNKIALLKTDRQIIEKYKELSSKINTSSQKQKKRLMREINILKEENKNLDENLSITEEIYAIKDTMNKNSYYKENAENYLHNEINKIINLLLETNLINYDNDYNITDVGMIASQLNEINAAEFAFTITKYDFFINFSTIEIVGLLSIFCNIRVEDDAKIHIPNTASKLLNRAALDVRGENARLQDMQNKHMINISNETEITFDFMNIAIWWCECKDSAACQQVIIDSELFLGDFLKAILKINNCAAELEKVAEITNNVDLLNKLHTIPAISLKYIVDNQSLYV